MSDETCPQCGHPDGPHALVATTGDPMDGGIMICPVAGCWCYHTWGVEGREAKRVPNPDETERIRAMIQEEAARERRSAEDPG